MPRGLVSLHAAPWHAFDFTRDIGGVASVLTECTCKS